MSLSIVTADELRQAIIAESTAVGLTDLNIIQMTRIAAAINREKQYTIWGNRKGGLLATSGSITIDEVLTEINRADLEAFGYTITDLPVDPHWVSSDALAPKHTISW
jgi:hypothetical protein